MTVLCGVLLQSGLCKLQLAKAERALPTTLEVNSEEALALQERVNELTEQVNSMKASLGGPQHVRARNTTSLAFAWWMEWF